LFHDQLKKEIATYVYLLNLIIIQLKLFAKQQTSGIKFDDSYVAKAYNDDELEQLFESQEIKNITICMHSLFYHFTDCGNHSWNHLLLRLFQISE
jgi:hypothetical protein